jgi:hypothetical protein
MNRKQSGAHQQAYPDFGQDRGIGLRAVAAAIRYQGDAGIPASVVTPAETTDGSGPWIA